MKKAVIIGAQGQDGRLLFEFLESRNYQVLGVGRSSIQFSKQLSKSDFSPLSIQHPDQVSHLIRQFLPDEVYYLAAYHHSSEDKPVERSEAIELSYQVNLYGLLCFLEAIRQHSPSTRLFYAASSHIFGNPLFAPQTEETPLRPDSDYGITKTAGMHYCQLYRRNYQLFTSVGILYNHESSFRKSVFLSKKIVQAAINIKLNKQNKLVLGNLDAQIDWGYAPDFIEAIHGVLQTPFADDFILSTGKLYSVRDFVREAFNYLELDWEKVVEENPEIITRMSHLKKNIQATPKVGNPTKIFNAIGWKHQTEFKEMIRLLLKAEIKAQDLSNIPGLDQL